MSKRGPPTWICIPASGSWPASTFFLGMCPLICCQIVDFPLASWHPEDDPPLTIIWKPVLQGDTDLFGVLPQGVFLGPKNGDWFLDSKNGSMDALWIVYDWFMDALWMLYGCFMDALCMLCGCFMAGLRMVYGWLMAIYWWKLTKVATCACTKSGMFVKYQTIQIWWVSRSGTQFVVPNGPPIVTPISGGICSVLVTCIKRIRQLKQKYKGSKIYVDHSLS